ncbi:hypothetical protein APHDU1_1291 [Anaplasma phagocytophilum]|nr:hypothetical protein APHWEB_1547 [Anaplasma phagocytophilum str. Webster]KJZ98288.1 hypothetical protein APHDU1_1291 [Anaplasma phagocytophilum]
MLDSKLLSMSSRSFTKDAIPKRNTHIKRFFYHIASPK